MKYTRLLIVTHYVTDTFSRTFIIYEDILTFSENLGQIDSFYSRNYHESYLEKARVSNKNKTKYSKKLSLFQYMSSVVFKIFKTMLISWKNLPLRIFLLKNSCQQ